MGSCPSSHRPASARMASSTRVPRMTDSSDPDTTLLDLLQRTPLASTARYRQVLGPVAVANTKGLEQVAEQQQARNAWLGRFFFEFAREPRLMTLTTDVKDHALRVPWVVPEPFAPGTPAPAYVAQVAASTRSQGGRATLA